MSKKLVAKASLLIDAPQAMVWRALVDPDAIKQYMFGATVISDWRAGSAILWRGEWQGRPFEDRGVILALVPERSLSYSHYSPLSGLPDVPGSYHTVSVTLEPRGSGTFVELAQDNNATDEEREHAERNWRAMLDRLKALVEKQR